MDYNFSLITLELGIPVITTITSLVGIVLYTYIYFQNYEESQAVILLLAILCFIYSALETLNIIISLSMRNSEIALNLYRFEQIIFTLTIIPWLLYIKIKLKLSLNFHSFLEKSYIVFIFSSILISSIALLYPKLFISIKEPITTLNTTMQYSIKSRGELGIIYILRDFILVIYFFILVCSFIYDMSINKKFKGNRSGLILISLIAISFFDDFNGISVYSKYSSGFLIFKELTFSRISLAYTIFNISIIHSCIGRFVHAIHKRSTQSYDLESIKAQDSIIINTAIDISEKLSKLKHNFAESVNNLVGKVKNTYSTINNLKSDINKIIENTNEFMTVENFQINDGKINIEKINELVSTYPNLQLSIELQKKTLEESNVKLQESIEKIYNLQSSSRYINSIFEDFQKKLEIEKEKFQKEFRKSESFNQLSFQINRIISFMNNMSDKTKTLAINSSIQASKSGEWYNNFSVVSREVTELVTETSQAADRMQELLFQIEEIFKKFNYASNNINSNIVLLIDDMNVYNQKLSKFNEDMEKQNDQNMNIIKSTDKIHNSISNMTDIIVNEENDFFNIKNQIEEINDYIINISEKAHIENTEVKNLMRDMNKLLATSDDMEEITNKLNNEMYKFLEYIDDLKNNMAEYSKVM